MSERQQLLSTVCSELDSSVAYGVSYGTFLEMTYPAKYAVRDSESIPGAPLECPLMSPPQTRRAAQFLVCQQCPYGITTLTEAENG